MNALNYGDVLMKQPERIADIVKSARRAVPDNDFCISVKMRVFDDLKVRFFIFHFNPHAPVAHKIADQR